MPSVSRYSTNGELLETESVSGFIVPENDYFEDTNVSNARVRGQHIPSSTIAICIPPLASRRLTKAFATSAETAWRHVDHAFLGAAYALRYILILDRSENRHAPSGFV